MGINVSEDLFTSVLGDKRGVDFELELLSSLKESPPIPSPFALSEEAAFRRIHVVRWALEINSAPNFSVDDVISQTNLYLDTAKTNDVMCKGDLLQLSRQRVFAPLENQEFLILFRARPVSEWPENHQRFYSWWRRSLVSE